MYIKMYILMYIFGVALYAGGIQLPSVIKGTKVKP